MRGTLLNVASAGRCVDVSFVYSRRIRIARRQCAWVGTSDDVVGHGSVVAPSLIRRRALSVESLYISGSLDLDVLKVAFGGRLLRGEVRRGAVGGLRSGTAAVADPRCSGSKVSTHRVRRSRRHGAGCLDRCVLTGGDDMSCASAVWVQIRRASWNYKDRPMFKRIPVRLVVHPQSTGTGTTPR